MTTGRKFPADVPRGWAAIEKEARKVRGLLDLPPLAPLPGWPLLNLFRRLVMIVGGHQVPLAYEVRELGPGVEAAACYKDGEIVVMLSTETNELLERNHPRARFSLPHELGHVTLHAPELIRLSTIPHPVAAMLRGRSDNLPSYRDAEWQANTFAGAMLVPADGLRMLEQNEGQLTVDLVRSHFKVSQDCARIRIDAFRKRRSELLKK